MSSIYSGTLQGTIRVAGRDIVITKKTRIFEVGKGLVDFGILVTDSPIYVSAAKRGDAFYARSVIVSHRTRDGEQGKTGVLDPGEPR